MKATDHWAKSDTLPDFVAGTTEPSPLVTTELVSRAAPLNTQYMRVYGSDPVLVDDILNGARALAYKKLGLHAIRYKHSDYTYEREWRLIISIKQENKKRMAKTRDRRGKVVPYVEFGV